MSKPTVKKLKLLSLRTNTPLYTASMWANMAMTKSGKTYRFVAAQMGMGDHDFTGRMSRGLTYDVVVRIAEVLNVPRPNLADLVRQNVDIEVQSLLNSPKFKELGLDVA